MTNLHKWILIGCALLSLGTLVTPLLFMSKEKLGYWLFAKGPIFILIAAGIIIGGVATFGSFYVKQQLDEISKQDKATKRLDAFSVGILDEMDGVHFINSSSFVVIDTLRQLTNLEILELDVFPSEPYLTLKYYLTPLGRYVLGEKLHKEIFPKNFCELLRIRHWRRGDKDFEKVEFKKRKDRFKKDFKISWEDAWLIFDSVLKPAEKPKEKIATSARWEAYDKEKTQTIFGKISPEKKNDVRANAEARVERFKTIMDEIVKPWSEKIKDPQDWLPSEKERKEILDLDGLLYMSSPADTRKISQNV